MKNVSMRHKLVRYTPIVAYRSRFGGDLQARTPQLGMGQLERDPAGQGPVGKVQLDRDQLFARDRHSTERISYVYKYQLATQVE